MSQSNVKDSGIFIYPLQRVSFANKTIYLRCVDGAGAEARVIPFEVGAGGGDISLSDNAFQDISLANGTVAFLNGAGQVVKYFNLPEEIFLRTVGTSFISNFSWSAQAYPNSTNPNLNGKPVLVLHIKGDSLNSPYEDWGFVNLEDLIDLYVPADASIAISNNSIKAAISADSNNLLSLKADGLFAGDDTDDDISDFQVALQQAFADTNADSRFADFQNALRQSFGFSS
ncbi:MAG: hypothetical protein IJP42_08105 [Selenomonadaceae bacterium]|nr:hypothetical protein [Selenomonadaceae bacterium]MBR0102440.1 hypothetical protein [Selenomonadaceae bacterium]